MYISSDTNIWLDFEEIGHLDHPFLLEHQYYISANALADEIHSSSLRDRLIANGLQTTEISRREWMLAISYQTQYPRLSIYDTFALAIAKCRAWILLTGDKPLKKAAEREQVECHGTIWIYDELFANGKLEEAAYRRALHDLISAVQNGKCRFPMEELLRRLT